MQHRLQFTSHGRRDSSTFPGKFVLWDNLFSSREQLTRNRNVRSLARALRTGPLASSSLMRQEAPRTAVGGDVAVEDALLKLLLLGPLGLSLSYFGQSSSSWRTLLCTSPHFAVVWSAHIGDISIQPAGSEIENHSPASPL